jgi:hypothetical protein
LRHVFLELRHVFLEWRHAFLELRHVFLELRHVFLELRHVFLELCHVFLELRHVFLEFRYLIPERNDVFPDLSGFSFLNVKATSALADLFSVAAHGWTNPSGHSPCYHVQLVVLRAQAGGRAEPGKSPSQSARLGQRAARAFWRGSFAIGGSSRSTRAKERANLHPATAGPE